MIEAGSSFKGSSPGPVDLMLKEDERRGDVDVADGPDEADGEGCEHGDLEYLVDTLDHVAQLQASLDVTLKAVLRCGSFKAPE